jgi:hypothetical protein
VSVVVVVVVVAGAGAAASAGAAGAGASVVVVVVVTAGAGASTLGASAGAGAGASSFLPQAVKDRASSAASRMECFIYCFLIKTLGLKIWLNAIYLYELNTIDANRLPHQRCPTDCAILAGLLNNSSILLCILANY